MHLKNSMYYIYIYIKRHIPVYLASYLRRHTYIHICTHVLTCSDKYVLFFDDMHLSVVLSIRQSTCLFIFSLTWRHARTRISHSLCMGIVCVYVYMHVRASEALNPVFETLHELETLSLKLLVGRFKLCSSRSGP